MLDVKMLAIRGLKDVTATDKQVSGEGYAIQGTVAETQGEFQLKMISRALINASRTEGLTAKIIDVLSFEEAQLLLNTIMTEAKDHAEGAKVVGEVWKKVGSRRSRLATDHLKMLAMDTETHILTLPNRWSTSGDKKPTLSYELRKNNDLIVIEIKMQQQAFIEAKQAEQAALLAKRESELGSTVEPTNESELGSTVEPTNESEQVLQSDLTENALGSTVEPTNETKSHSETIEPSEFKAFFDEFDKLELDVQNRLLIQLQARSKAKLQATA